MPSSRTCPIPLSNFSRSSLLAILASSFARASLVAILASSLTKSSLEIAAKARKLWMQIWVPYAALIKVVMDQIRTHFPDVEISSSKEEFPEPPEFATA